MNRHLTSLIVLACAATFACGGEKPAPPPPAGGSTTTATVAPPAAVTTGQIGIAECDEYLTKYEACVRSKVPAAQKAQLEQALEQYRTAWRSAAVNPQARASLATTCQQALTTARMAMGAYGCQW